MQEKRRKAGQSLSPEVADTLHRSLVDYDGAPLTPPEHRGLFVSDDIDSTTCLFPFEVKVDKSARFPLGKRLVPCGKCEDCRRRIRNGWYVRLYHEAKAHAYNYFVTLTYDEEHLLWDDNGNPCVYRRDIQTFLKRLRKRIYPDRIRYFGIAEYGPQTYRPHYHIIVFGWNPNIASINQASLYMENVPLS